MKAKTIFAILICIFLSSCATLFNWRKNEVVIDTFPKGAKVSVKNQEVGQTPCLVKIDKKVFKKSKVKVEKENYNNSTITVGQGIHASFWLNGVFIFVTTPIDIATKRMVKLSPYEYKQLKSVTGFLSPYDSVPNAKNLSMWDENIPFGTYYFQGKKPKERITDGGQSQAVAAINSYFTLRFKKTDSLLTVYTFSVMDRKKSWRDKIVSKKERREIIKHEKAHFDITEIYCRKFKKAMSEAKFERSTYKENLNALYEKYIKLLLAAQIKYDRETAHSMNEATQQLWYKKIAEELEKTAGWGADTQNFIMP